MERPYVVPSTVGASRPPANAWTFPTRSGFRRACARAACEHFDHGPPVSWREGLCDAEAGLDCDLFDPAPTVLDDAWAPGCAMPVAYDVVCESVR